MDTHDTPASLPAAEPIPSDDGRMHAERAAVTDAGSGHPPLVIRGERYQYTDPDTGERSLFVPTLGKRRGELKLIPLPDDTAHPGGAIIDWLNFTFPMGKYERALPEFFALLFEYLGPKFSPAKPRATGFHFYDRSFDLGGTGAKFACGGNSGTGLLSLSGEACSLIPDWQRVIELGRDRLNARISRVDPARDDYRGTHSVDHAMQLYLEGAFGSGGRLPTMKQHGNWQCPDGTGRSIAIGKRENGKRLQVYEKGMQLGAQWHPWTRWELSIGNTGRLIPWDVLLAPGRYLAGAYPKALNWISTTASQIVTIQKQTQIGYDALVGHASNQYGALLGIMQQVEGSAERVLEKLTRSGTPRRLQHPALNDPAQWIE